MKEFKLFNQTWKIEYVPELKEEDDQFFYGQTNPISRTITIAKEVNGIKQSKEDMRLTLLHELVHVMFLAGLYKECNMDEPLVEWLANCMMSLSDQKIL